MRPRMSNLRYEASVLGVPYRRLLHELRDAGAIQRDPNGRGHTVRDGWHDKFRARLHWIHIAQEDGGGFHKVVSVLYCTQHGRAHLADLARNTGGQKNADRGNRR